MRLKLAHVTLSLLLVAGSGAAVAQEATAEDDGTRRILIVDQNDDNLSGPGDVSIGFGRSTVLDTMRLDVREALIPDPSEGPVSSPFCSPSVPD